MQIKPPSLQAAKAGTLASQAAKPAPTAGKPGDFAQLLKAQQAEAPATPHAAAPAPTRS